MRLATIFGQITANPQRAWRAATSAVIVLALAWSASAQGKYPRDKAASKKIQEAITNHYLAMNFGQAENVLIATIKACADKCSPQTLARGWMYVGIVRGSARGETAGAREAFEKALELDPRVELDDALATPNTQATFTATKAASKKGRRKLLEPVPVTADEADTLAESAPEEAAAPPGAGLHCGSLPRSVQTRRPIPIACESEEAAASATLRYREFRGSDWKTLKMTRSGSSFRAEIPCDATKNPGNLSLFVVAADSAGDPVDVLGSKGSPIEIDVATKVSEPPPAFPGEPPPARCKEEVICPPDFPGCQNKNEPLEVQSCESDSDCKSGECSEGVCIVESESSSSLSASVPRNWFGLHFAVDVGFIGGDNVCSSTNGDFNCFSGGSNPYPGELPPAAALSEGELGDPYPGTGISSGAALGTMRVLASYQRVLSESFMAEGRAGFAFKGGPATRAGSTFLPVHGELRGSYWLRGVAASGLRPYLHLGGGIAQVDVKMGDVNVRDCSQLTDRDAFLDCINAEGAYDSANDPQLPEQRLEAYRKLGQAFVTTGGGMVMALGERTGLQLNVNAMFMLPTSGIVIEPSLGLVYGL